MGRGRGSGCGEVYPISMQVTLDIPDTFAAALTAAGKEPARAALVALAMEGYRAHRLTESGVRRMVGYGTRMEVHALLAEHNISLYTEEMIQQEIAASDKFLAERNAAQAGDRI